MAEMSTTLDGSSAHFSPPFSDCTSRLPDEILVNVFWQRILSAHVRQNANLRSVCRRWKMLVDLTPTLWSKIRIEPSGYASSVLACRRLAQFCIKRSRNSPLDIDLDLGFTAMDEMFHGYPRQIEGAASRSDILELVNAVTEGDDNSQTQFGQNSEHETTSLPMLRWQRFRIVLGRIGQDTTNSILLKLIHPTPLLEKLEILDWLYDPNGVAMTLDVFSNPAVFPYFNNLTSFSTNFEIQISHFLHRNHAFTGVSLRSLSVLANQLTLRHILGYPNLSELRISHGGMTPIDSPILFPQLLRLTIEGGSLAWQVTTVDAPNLQRLRMSSDRPQQCPTSSLFLTIQSLEWDVPFKPYDVRDFSVFLSSVFAQCPRLEDLTVWSLSRSILASSGGEFEGIVERLLKEHPLPSLKSITLLRPRTGDFDHAEVAIVIRPPSPQRR